MNKARALALAIGSMKAEIQRLAVEGNLYDRYKLRTAAGETARRQRAQLREAVALLTQEAESITIHNNSAPIPAHFSTRQPRRPPTPEQEKLF